MEDVKYVKIVKAMKPTFWYSDKIGEVYKVKNYDELDYLVLNVEENYYLIKKEDCVELKQVKRPAKPGDYILITNPDFSYDYEKGDILIPSRRLTGGVLIHKIFISDHEYVVLEEPEEEELTATITVDINREQLEKLLENIGHLAFKVIELERRVEELEKEEEETLGGFPYEPYL